MCNILIEFTGQSVDSGCIWLCFGSIPIRATCGKGPKKKGKKKEKKKEKKLNRNKISDIQMHEVKIWQ